MWHGVLDPSLLFADFVTASQRLADAAKVGDWSMVFDLLNDPAQQVDVNWWRPGGTAWFTILHQAAWHGAPAGLAISAETGDRRYRRSTTIASSVPLNWRL